MLRLPAFKLYRPRTLAEAAAILDGEGAGGGGRAGEGGGTGQTVRLVAGGTDLWPNMKRRHQKAATVVSLMGVAELAGVRNGGGNGGSDRGGIGGGEMRLGATTLLDDVARHPLIAGRYPALARAVASISSPPLRNMGTIGGNVCLDTRCTYYNQTEDWRRAVDYCMKEEGKICWVATSSPRCWAHSASDSAPVLCALGARVRLVSRRGERVVPLAELYRDDGIDYLSRRLDEIVVEIVLPEEAAHPPGHLAGSASAGGGESCRAAFWKLRRRGSIDFAVLSVAAALWIDDAAGTVARARLYLGAVGSRPVAAAAAAELLAGRELTAELAQEAGRLARKAATPMDNTDFQAQWRGAMVAKYTEAALREAAGLDRERLPPQHSWP